MTRFGSFGHTNKCSGLDIEKNRMLPFWAAAVTSLRIGSRGTSIGPTTPTEIVIRNAPVHRVDAKHRVARQVSDKASTARRSRRGPMSKWKTDGFVPTKRKDMRD